MGASRQGSVPHFPQDTPRAQITLASPEEHVSVAKWPWDSGLRIQGYAECVSVSVSVSVSVCVCVCVRERERERERDIGSQDS